VEEVDEGLLEHHWTLLVRQRFEMSEENPVELLAKRQRWLDELNESEGPPAETALGLLQAIYRNPMEPTSVRMRAASIAIPFESPKLSVTTVLGDEASFAAMLDRAIERSKAPPKVIDHRADETSPSVSWSGPMHRPIRRLRNEA
jgi:hypothetical protein